MRGGWNALAGWLELTLAVGPHWFVSGFDSNENLPNRKALTLPPAKAGHAPFCLAVSYIALILPDER